MNVPKEFRELHPKRDHESVFAYAKRLKDAWMLAQLAGVEQRLEETRGEALDPRLHEAVGMLAGVVKDIISHRLA